MTKEKKYFPKILLNQSESYYLRELFRKVLVKDVMITDPITLNVDDPFHLVEEKFRVHQIRHLPVLDKDEKLVGLITQRDLFRIQPPHVLEDGTQYYDRQSLDSNILKYVMNKNLQTLKLEDHMADVIKLMAEKKFGCIPVVNPSGVLLGIVTQTDVMRMCAQIIQE